MWADFKMFMITLYFIPGSKICCMEGHCDCKNEELICDQYFDNDGDFQK